MRQAVISREEAIQKGLKYYFTGIPCIHSHISKRVTKTFVCVECIKERNKKPEHIERLQRWYGNISHAGKMLMWAKYRHKYGGWTEQFDLTEKDLDWPEDCPALGIKLRYEAQRSKSAPDAPTIDRIDPARGYVKGNVQILSRKANRIKNDGSPEEVMRVATFMQRRAA